jgi:hypothetical protein
MSIRFGWSVIIGLLLVCALSGSSSVHASAAKRATHSILVDRGSSGGLRWAVGLMRGAGRDGGQRPCVATQIIDTRPPSEIRGFSYDRELKVCSPLPKFGPPNIVSLSVGEGDDQLMVFGLAFVPTVSEVRLDFGDAGSRMMRLRSLNSVQMRNAGCYQSDTAH